jgi:hypothetical protein
VYMCLSISEIHACMHLNHDIWQTQNMHTNVIATHTQMACLVVTSLYTHTCTYTHTLSHAHTHTHTHKHRSGSDSDSKGVFNRDMLIQSESLQGSIADMCFIRIEDSNAHVVHLAVVVKQKNNRSSTDARDGDSSNPDDDNPEPGMDIRDEHRNDTTHGCVHKLKFDLLEGTCVSKARMVFTCATEADVEANQDDLKPCLTSEFYSRFWCILVAYACMYWCSRVYVLVLMCVTEADLRIHDDDVFGAKL